uniref:nuclear exosome regulator NRDE2-like n=1 Tax=Styela clava TaxID=7725 RepID=UPI00193A7DC8|nr:nuclear exosome regulator NRDE2-like [Styela clava]
MSLFPAAATTTFKKKEDRGHKDWLKNESFLPETASVLTELEDRKHESDTPSDDSSDVVETKVRISKSKKRKKKEKHRSLSPKYKKQLKTADSVKNEKLSVIVDQLRSDMPIFQADKIPDMDNVHFGRLYKVYTSKYYRDLACCVGTPIWQYIKIKESKKKRRRKRANDETNHRYFGTKLPVADTFSGIHKQGRKLQFLTDNYIAITGNSEDQTNENDEIDSNETLQRSITEKLNRRVRENPQDIDGWMELLSWQDEVFKGSLVHGRSRIISEKKIEILNQAIKANPRDAKLHLMKLRLKSEIASDHVTLDNEWENLLFRFPDNIEVWRGYIFYINCNSVSTFSLNRTRRAFSHCVEILRSIKDGLYKQDTSSEISAEDRLVEVFQEYTDFLSATGHMEQLTSLYQCMIELNFRSQDDIGTWAEHIDAIRQYFVSNEPKVGEKDSKGFNAWIMKNQTGGWVSTSDNTSMTEDDIEDDVDPSLNLTQNWLNIEKSRCDKQWLRWQPSFEGDECHDSERIVSFSSIKDLLFVVDSKLLKIVILKNFVRIMGSAQHYGSTTSKPLSSQNIFSFSHPDQVLKQDERLYGMKPLLFRSFGSIVASKHTFLCEVFCQLITSTCDDDLKTMLCGEYMTYHEHRVICVFIEGKTSQLRKTGKEARKAAKQILSDKPDLLHIWCSLAIIEWICGKRNEACKIFQTTLSMSVKSLQTADRTQKRKLLADIHYICKTFAILHLTMCETCFPSSNHTDSKTCDFKLAVIRSLCALGDNYKFAEYFSKTDSNLHSVSIMKASAGFTRLIEESQSLYEQFAFEKNDLNSDANPSDYFNLFICQFIFSIHSKSQILVNFENAFEFLHTKQISCSKQVKIDLEHLYHYSINILQVFSPQSRSIHTKVVSDAATDFPFNTYFAEKLGEIYMPSYLCGNVRKHYRKICNETDSVIPWLCAIKFELHRRNKLLNACMSSSDNVESKTHIDTRIRNLFEHALSVGTNMGSLVLWQAYLAAEIEFGSDRVQSVYTRAINSCSWSKELHLAILTVNPDLLVDVVSHMTKKGLRVRTPIEEIQLLMTI